MLDSDCENAIQLYSKMGKHIQSLASLNGYTKLKTFLKKWFDPNSDDSIVKDLLHAASLYDKAELSGRDYARKARSFAEENKLVANGVLEGKKHYGPEDVLEAFEDMAEGLLKEYGNVIKKYDGVVARMTEISLKAGKAKELTHREVEDARKGIVRHFPIAAPFVGAVEWGNKFSGATDSVPLKAVLGLVGAIIGTIKGAISSVLVVPLVSNIVNHDKYKQMTKDLGELEKELEKVESTIKEHRELLAKINGFVDNLSEKYKKIKGRKKLSPAKLDLIVAESKKLITACDNYLSK